MPTSPENQGGGFQLATGPSPSGVQPTGGEEKPTATRPPFPKKEPAPPPPPPPTVKISSKDTPVAILGFSGSGKTVYLTMLYYATGVTHSFPEEWDSDYLALDPSGKTDSYLKEAYKRILGIGSDGKLVFQDPLGQRVQRNFPKGTDEQEMLQFLLTRSTGVGHHNLNVNTLDVKGEALRRFAANLSIPKPEELARDPSLRIDYQRWQQMRGLCEQAGAILLFFNLLNWEDYDHTADVNTLVGLLLNQKRPPKAFAFVVTGIDILKDENEVEQRREKIVKEFEVAIRRLERSKIAWQVLMISNFGRGFTRKIEVLPAGHPCSGKRAGHICNRCQELVPDVNARPTPQNLEAPWEFVYQAVRDGNRAKWIKRGLLAFGLGLLPLGLVTWSLLSGWQQNQRLSAILAEGLTDKNLPVAVKAEQELSSNSVYNFFSGGPTTEREQVRLLGAAAAIFNDNTKSPDVRLKAAIEVKPKLSPPFAKLVPVEDLQTGSELDGITNVKASLVSRLKASNAALSSPERKQNQTEYQRVVKLVENFLGEQLLDELKKKRGKLDEVMKGDPPALLDEEEYVKALLDMQDEIGRPDIRALKGAAEVRSELKPMTDDFTVYTEYVKVARMEEKTVEQAQAKAEALRAFSRLRAQHVLGGAASMLYVNTNQNAKDLVSGTDFTSLPNFRPEEMVGSQRNFTQFANVLLAYTSFINKHRTGARVDEIRKRVTEMKSHATGMLSTLKEGAERERSAMRAQAVKLSVADWEKSVGQTETDIRAVNDLAKILELQQVDALPVLTELLGWKNASREVARVTAEAPKDDRQMEAQRKALDDIVARLKDDVPARAQALLDKNFLEDKLLANDLDSLSKALDKPEAASLESPESAIQVALDNYKRYIDNAEKKLATPDRKKRFQEYLTADKRADPLKTAIEGRDRFQAKLDEKRLWARIDAAQKKRDPSARQQSLADTQAYLDKYPSGERVTEVKAFRQFVESWRVEAVKFEIDIFEATTASNRLTVSVRPAGGGAPLVSKNFAVANRTIPESAGPKVIEFNWNSAQDLEVEVIVISAAGQEIYKHVQPVSSAQFADDMSKLFPMRANIRFKLKPQK